MTTSTQPESHTFAEPALTFPIRLYAQRDQPLSRWLWLVKWVLLIPHGIVLAALWVAFAVLTVVAWVAVLITARYPRPIFDFNIGVLRWTWRVGYYGYSALGTDRYPPFTLAEVSDYPARLEVDYPAQLSRGLALVKWWLLAIPHYLVVGVLLSGPRWVRIGSVDSSGNGAVVYQVGGTGLISLLVLFVAVALLFTGQYPRGLFDLIMGLNRWVARVFGYAALFTDQYPPLRLDQGGDDVGSPHAPASP